MDFTVSCRKDNANRAKIQVFYLFFYEKDFRDDEKGLLPPDLKRGVLSEDGIWNLLEEVRSLKERMQDLSKT